MWRFSGSQQADFHRCPRYGFLRYFAEDGGIEPKSLNLALETGTMVHRMVALTLGRRKGNSPSVPVAPFVTKAVSVAAAEYRERVKERSLGEISDFDLELQRQSALAEGLFRAWCRVRLPVIEAQNEIVSVEEEWLVPLLGDTSFGIEKMERLDAVLRNRESGQLRVLELKTTGMDAEDYFESWRYDTQTLTHLWAVERHFGEIPECVMMEFLYKGLKRKDEAGMETYYSPLLRGYVLKAETGFDSDEYSSDSAQGRRKGWQPFDVWSRKFPEQPDWMSSMEYWVEHVLEPALLREKVVFTREVNRADREVQMWERQTMFEQQRLQESVELFRSVDDPSVAQQILNSRFPARLDQGCYSDKFRKRCSMLPICYGDIDDPLGSGKYVKRKPHHATEVRDE